MDRVKEIVAIQAVGRASGGFLSNPGNGLLILVAVFTGLGIFAGAPVVDSFINVIKNAQGILEGETDADKQIAANGLIDAMRALLKPFLGPLVP